MKSRSAPENQRTFLALSLSDAKNFLRVDNSSDDSLITALIDVATDYAEDFIDQKIAERTINIFYDDFPGAVNTYGEGSYDAAISEINGSGSILKIPFGNAQSIANFYTYDDDNTAYSFASSNYYFDKIEGRIGLKAGAVWPSTILRPLNGVQVQVVAGYASAGAIPSPIVHALRLIVSKLFENRGDQTSSEFFGTSGFVIPNTAAALLTPYRKFKVHG